jgi:L-rhamnose-H+ transport protein
MNPNPFLGVLLHALGGFAAGSFYIPFKRVRNWAWESYWLVGGVFSWIIAPWALAFLTCPDIGAVLRGAPGSSLFWSYFFGILWGIGGLTFGLSMRYLGMSLGYALALGFCAAFGTLIPPLFKQLFPALVLQTSDLVTFSELALKTSGKVTLTGVVVCLLGIAICGRAGVFKERELSSDEKRATIREFDFAKGFWVAVFAGIMSACMAFGIAAGAPVAKLAVQYGTPELWRNTPVFIVILAGGFTTNFLWCAALNIRNRTAGDYIHGGDASLITNYMFSAAAGVTWYLQFMFYGMGTTQMGRYGFSSWTIHMAFIIVFSNLWALLFREWRGTSRKTHNMILAGLVVLILSTLVVGLGNYIEAVRK